MVGEFPELQGVMGGYYAAAQGEDPQVAAAIRDHYKPVGQGDEVPTAPVTVAVSLADKLDSIFGFFSIGAAPTGSKDPFALRRSGIAVIALIVGQQIRVRLWNLLIAVGIEHFGLEKDRNSKAADYEVRNALRSAFAGREPTDQEVEDALAGRSLQLETEEIVRRHSVVIRAVTDFFADRLKVQQREAGVRHDLIDAVFALGGEDDLVRLLARVRALQAFVGTDDGANLLAGYKRAANILKKEGYAAASDAPEQKVLSYTPEPAENALITALDAAEPAAADAVAREDFTAAMAALATLRAPIDAFFDGVTVNDPDAAKRLARLALLDRVRAAVHTVADFSRIEG